MQIIVKIAVAVIFPISLFGQINFLRHYSDSGSDFGHGVVQLEDSSYVICGASSSFKNGPSQGFLMKVDSLGNYIWSHNYGGFESESLKRVMYVPNSGFYAAGFSNSTGVGAYDLYLVKTDVNGVLEWERTYGSPGWDRINDAVLARDTGVVMVGETNSNLTTGQDIYIVRTNKMGDTLWTKTISGAGPDVATSIVPFQDSLFLVAGDSYFLDSLSSKPMYVLLHEDGTVIDQRFLTSLNGTWKINDITIINNQVQGIGSFQDNVGSSWEIAHFSLSLSSSSIQSPAQYHGSNDGDLYGRHMTVYRDTTRRYLTYEHHNHPNAYEFGVDLMISRYSWYLSFELQVASIATYYNDLSGQVIPTSDGGALVVGSREGIGIGGGSVFLNKIGPGEVYPTVEGVTSYSQLVKINELSSLIDARIYPNPASKSFTVDIEDNGNYDIQLLNSIGQIVSSASVTGTQAIDISRLSAGIYTVLILRDSVGAGVYRLVIQQ